MVGLSLEMVRLRLPFLTYKFNCQAAIWQKMNNVKLDMAVVPAIGVDGAMARIGHGKGFYDRFFDTLPIKPKTDSFLRGKRLLHQRCALAGARCGGRLLYNPK